MSRKYIRSATVIIGNQKSVNTPNALKITDLRIVFNLEKDIFGFPNIGRVSIYNLSPASRAKIEKEYIKLILIAGYKGDEKILFTGDILYIYHRRDGQGNVITEFYMGDGHLSYSSSFFNKTLAPNLSKKEIFNNVASSFNFPLGDISGIDDTASSIRGQVLSGPSKSLLTQQAENMGLYWSIQDENVIAFPKKGNRPGTVYIFNALNGMIKSPVITEIGVTLEVLLDVNLKPGTLFKVNSVGANINIGSYYFRNVQKTFGEGTYRIDKLVHKGDTHGNVWNTEIEGFLLI